jgi:hypothetical protein
MRPTVRRFWTILTVLIVAMFLSGCIVWTDCWWCDHYPPRQAKVHVYVNDIWCGLPISWASVALYERDWWTWDYLGTWSADAAGHVTVYGDYLERDDCGDCDGEDYRLVVSAPGYFSESFVIELDYYHPSETLYFYLVPCCGRDGEIVAEGEVNADRTPDHELPGRVVVGGPTTETPELSKETGL